MMEYKDLAVSQQMHKAIERMGFTQMTEIQEKAIPVMLEGREIIAKAPTGTGKTCAFGIPIVEKVEADKPWLQALVLCPTRELCTQICDDLRNLAYFKEGVRVVAVYGGQPMGKQLSALKNRPQIVVATPGRLLDHMTRKTIRLDKVKYAVLDEADEMLDMGFFKDVRKILDRLPKDKQMVMFSATISREVMDIGWLYQMDPVELTVLPVEASKPKITKYCIQSTGSKKLRDLVAILKQKEFHRTLIFCNTKYATSSLCGQLVDRGFAADCLHGDMAQSDRNRIMAAYKAGKIAILIATDVAARGIDVTDVDAVIHYETPLDNETYTHRSGRTGRAGKEGEAYLFYAPDDKKRLDNIIRYTKSVMIPLEITDEGEIREKSDK